MKKFMKSGGYISNSHIKGNMPTENAKQKLEMIVSENMNFGETAKIVLTKMSQGGLSYPRVYLLVGIYNENNFVKNFNTTLYTSLISTVSNLKSSSKFVVCIAHAE